MFGKNVVASPSYREDGGLRVFGQPWYTIQGEGPDAGLPAIFLRLANCNLRCTFCDTEFSGGQDWLLSSLTLLLTDMLATHQNCQLVVITGGEPMLQNFIPLAEWLNSLDVRVAVETAGTVMPPGLAEYFTGGANSDFDAMGMLTIVCSPKTPKVNEKLIPFIDAFKYIVSVNDCSEQDGLPVRGTQPGTENTLVPLFRPDPAMSQEIFVQAKDVGSPILNKLNLEHAARVAMQYGYRVSVQTHKLLGVE
jgi:7-carboxy-7-deazaguanine synthase